MTRAEELTDFVCSAAALFLSVEEGRNPAVRTYWDALHYVSTSLSVGYANIHPVTQAGKLLGAVVQMVGPALSSRALDSGDPELTNAMLTELRSIRALLAARPRVDAT
ncbi:MAG: ion channel [Myxococcales bacterium]